MAKKRLVKKKKRNKRSITKYPALDPTLNLRTRTELIDFDYIDKLSDKEKQWLNKFTEEYVVASFKKERHKNLHKNKKLKKSIYDANNARNRCIYTKNKAQGKLEYIEDLKLAGEEQAIEIETELINKIDNEELLTKELDNLNNSSGNTTKNRNKSN